MNDPLVSVIYPVYNDLPEDIRLSLTSIVEQDYQNLEIIIIDDSTKPESIKAIDDFIFDKRLVVIRKLNKAGLAAALNCGLELATGKYIARADADDIQRLNRIRKQVEFLEKNPQVGILGSNINYIDEKRGFVKERSYPASHSEILKQIHLRNPFCHSVIMIRKSVLDTIGHYNPDFKRAEDYELWFRAANKSINFSNLQEVLMDYKMATASKRDDLNWKMNLKLKWNYFSVKYFITSSIGIASVIFYLYAPKSIQNFVYNKMA